MKYILLVITTLLLLGTVSAECFDSDGGKNKYEFGGVTENAETFQDACEEQNIREYFCSVEGVASYTILPCVNGCAEGACQLANEVPRSLAPEEEGTTNTMTYLYIVLILIIVGLYAYWFKIRKKKKKY